MRQSKDAPAESGVLHGIGIGPGDPRLVTLKAWELLSRAPVIAYPAPETGPSLTREIVAPHLEARQSAFIEIPLRMPICKERFPARAAYDQAEALLSAELRAGKDVAVLCEGDPFLYGSFMYLFARMTRKFPVEIVPGVSSIHACAAAIETPLAARDDRVSIVPAGLPDERIMESIQATETCVLVKVGRHIARLRRLLAAASLLERAHYIEYAAMERQRLLPLREYERDAAPYFSVIVVYRDGEAGGFRKETP